MLYRLSLARTSLFTIFFVCSLLGLALVRIPVNLLVSPVIVWLALVSSLLLIRIKNIPLVLAMVIGLLSGYWRGSQFLQTTKPLVELHGQAITAYVRATSDGVYGDHSQVLFDADHLQLEYPYKLALPGSLQIAGFGETAIYRGDIVQVEGNVALTRGSKQLRMSFADLRVIEHNHSPIDTIRRRFAAGMQSSLPEPHASFAMGLLIGQKSTLPGEFAAMLSAVGLTHIIAVSGYNLNIIADASRKALARGSKYQIMVCSAMLITLFVLTTGFSASIVRAALVSLLSLLAWYYGRRFKPLLLISLVAAATAGWNPFYIWSDIGWYLSFLAFFGVMVIAPLVNQRLYKTPNPSSTKALITESICAMLATIPFILYIFNQMSLIALVANLLVVPFVPLAMLLTLIAGLAGMLVPSIAGWFAWPAKILLTYMLDIVSFLSQIPHVLVRRQLSIIGMLTLYAALCTVLIILWRKQSKTVTITEIKRSTTP